MDSKILKVCLIAALAAGISACDSSEEKSGCTETCMKGIAVQCVNGSPSFIDCTPYGGCDESGLSCKKDLIEMPAVSDCFEGQVKCENNVEWLCSEKGEWNEYEVCVYGCSGRACAPNPEKECVSGVTKCEDDASWFCFAEKWEKTQDCTNGCNELTGLCLAAEGEDNEEGCGAEGALRCYNDNVEVCRDGEWILSEACDNGCTNGVCDEEEDDGEIKACQYFDCTETYGEACETEYSIKTALCKDGHAYCVERKPENDSKCDKGEKAYISDGQDYCLSVGKSEACLYAYAECDAKCFVEDMTCAQYCKTYEHSDICYMDSVNVYCEDPTTPTDGCGYETKCNGNVAMECFDLSFIGMGFFESAVDCSKNGLTCANVNGVSACYNTCDVENEVKNSCEVDAEDGSEYSSASVCVKGEDGKLYLDAVEMTCAAACHDGKCDVLDEDEGKSCDYNFDYEYCKGNIMLYCGDYDTWEALDCKYSYGPEYECLTAPEDSDYVAECAIPCSASEVGNRTTSCEFSSYYSAYVQYTYECKQVAFNQYSYQFVTGRYCGDVCDKDGLKCVPILDNEGETCDSSFTESCEGNIVSYCAGDDTIASINCSQSSGYSCHVSVDKKEANCIADENECSVVGEVKGSCSSSLFSAVSTSYVCSEMTDGKKYWVKAGSKNCSNGCNAAGTDCESSSSDGGYVDCGTLKCGDMDCDSACELDGAGLKAYCALEGGQYYYACGQLCDKVGTEGSICTTYSDGTFVSPSVCTRIGDRLIMVDNAKKSSDYRKCPMDACNADSTDCQ